VGVGGVGVGRTGVRLARAGTEDVRDGQVETAARPGAEQVAPEEPGRNADEQAEDQDEPDVGADELGGGDRAGVRRHEGVHDGERPRHGQPVAQHAPAEAPGHREHDRQEDDETGVEEDREPEEQRGDAQRERCALLAERSISVSASTCAPPLTSSSRPIMAPNPTSSATLASVKPNPVVSADTTSPTGMPMPAPASRALTSATRRLTATSATNACSLTLMMRNSRSATAVAAMSSSGAVPYAGTVSSVMATPSVGPGWVPRRRRAREPTAGGRRP
jgi:hypothetical protein